jgi:hypothetical protein
MSDKDKMSVPDTVTLTIVKTITAARWKKAETAFYKHAEVTSIGTILNLRTAILAALKELLT